MAGKVTRQFVPSPWHDALGHDYRQTGDAIGRRYGLTVDELRMVYYWTVAARRYGPCPH